MEKLLEEAIKLHGKIKLLILEHEQEIKLLCERHERELEKAREKLAKLDEPKIKKIKIKVL